jgi:hypothetical protein
MGNLERIISLPNPNDHGDGQRSPDVGRACIGASPRGLLHPWESVEWSESKGAKMYHGK